MPAAPPDVAHLLENDVPAWARIDFDVLCSRCGYNLRTLTTPRCTECGLEFEWPYVLHQSGCRSEFLFEHNWRARPIRAFFDTIWRARNPWRFWRSVSIHDRVHPRPLIFMLLFSPVIMWLLLMPLAAWLSHVIAWLDRAVAGSSFATMLGWAPTSSIWTTSRADDIVIHLSWLAIAPLDWTQWSAIALAGVALVSLHLGALGVVLLLRVSLRRFRIRAVHVVRAVCYSAGPISLWWALIVVAMTIYKGSYRQDEALQLVFLLAALAIAAMYLAVAAKTYLGIPHPRLLGFLAYLTAFLFVACVAVISVLL